MPNQPKTPHTSVRIPPDLKKRAAAKAASEGRNLSTVIVALLESYISTPPERP